MKIHELKTWPEAFAAIIRGEKRHEIRRDDRGFQPGDVLWLREWKPTSGEYTGDSAIAQVTHLTPAGGWGLPDVLCVMSIRLMCADWRDG